jgi:hypothetical protein
MLPAYDSTHPDETALQIFQSITLGRDMLFVHGRMISVSFSHAQRLPATDPSFHLPNLDLVLLLLRLGANRKHGLFHASHLLGIRYQSLFPLELGIVQDDDVPHSSIVVTLVGRRAFLFPDQGAKGRVGIDSCVTQRGPYEGSGRTVLQGARRRHSALDSDDGRSLVFLFNSLLSTVSYQTRPASEPLGRPCYQKSRKPAAARYKPVSRPASRSSSVS